MRAVICAVVVGALGVLGGMAITGFGANGAAPPPPARAKAAQAPPAKCVNGKSDLGDTWYPGIGNGGYDVAHYDLNLKYDPTSHLLDGKATITAAAKENLCRFNLDLRGMTVSSVTVNHAAADFTRDGRELIITPAQPLPVAEKFTTEVLYNGEPGPAPRDPDNFIDGWNYTEN